MIGFAIEEGFQMMWWLLVLSVRVIVYFAQSAANLKKKKEDFNE